MSQSAAIHCNACYYTNGDVKEILSEIGQSYDQLFRHMPNDAKNNSGCAKELTKFPGLTTAHCPGKCITGKYEVGRDFLWLRTCVNVCYENAVADGDIEMVRTCCHDGNRCNKDQPHRHVHGERTYDDEL